MSGHETFREAVARLTLATLQAAQAAAVTLDEIDLFVYHQANGRILSAVGERLGLPSERVVDCIARVRQHVRCDAAAGARVQRARRAARAR